MLGNLMPPPVVPVQTTPDTVVGGWIEVHPRYRAWLEKCGIRTADTALSLSGEIVSGHPARHVMRVELRSATRTRTVYLKREHQIGWSVRLASARAGFGLVSRSEREAKILARLDEAGLPGVQWIAYGQDRHGQAFLMVDDLVGYHELRGILAKSDRSPAARAMMIAHGIGTMLAETHLAGFRVPSLSAKHLFFQENSLRPILIDWQSPQSLSAPNDESVAREFAVLHATTTDALASPRERLRVLWAYRRMMKVGLKQEQKPSLRMMVEAILRSQPSLNQKSSITSQRMPAQSSHDQRLVWLAGEAVCAVPAVAKDWPTPADCAPFYPHPGEPFVNARPITIRMSNAQAATLVRYREWNPVASLIHHLRSRRRTSAGVAMARVLFQLDRAGVDVPAVFAFGQRRSRGAQESFVLFSQVPGERSWQNWHTDTAMSLNERRTMLTHVGETIRAIHDSRCLLQGNLDCLRMCADVTQNGRPRNRLLVLPQHGIVLTRQASESTQEFDFLACFARLSKLIGRTDRLRLIVGYCKKLPDTTRKTTMARLFKRSEG